MNNSLLLHDPVPGVGEGHRGGAQALAGRVLDGRDPPEDPLVLLDGLGAGGVAAGASGGQAGRGLE